MSSKNKREKTQKPLWRNPVLLLSIGLVAVFGAFYFSQQGGSEPKPYEYNPATNKHWDPQHKHWHDGPPPAPGQKPAANPEAESRSIVPTSESNAAATAAPKPYEYNPNTNQYWDPAHGHWHNGPPPPPESQKVVNTVPPVAPDTSTHKPYEYDRVKNQYWDPDHKHWHSGKPPNQTLIPPIRSGGK